MRALLVLLGLLCFAAHADEGLSARIALQTVLTAGLRHHDAPEVWQDLAVGDAIALVREAGNPHDGNAVRVQWNDRLLGYLPRAQNRFVARQLDRGARLQARIAGIGKHRNNRRRLEIEIYAPLDTVR